MKIIYTKLNLKEILQLFNFYNATAEKKMGTFKNDNIDIRKRHKHIMKFLNSLEINKNK